MFKFKVFVGAGFELILLLTMGCGGGSGCNVIGLNVTPGTASADHTAPAPGNSQAFSSSFLFGGGNAPCTANTAALVSANWTASDPSVHFSSSPASMVTATCTAAVTGPVTITATSADGQMLMGRASLTCN